MSLWKRGEWFWADFSVNGVRYRVPLKDTKGRRIHADDEHIESAARAVFGQLVSLTATVSPATGTGTPDGSVTFRRNSPLLLWQ